LGLADEQGFPHKGYVDFVDNQLNPEAGTIRLRAVFSNKERLFTPGLFARIRLVGSGTYPAKLVLDRAVGTDQDKKFVLVLKPDSTIDYRPVKLGRLVDGLRVVDSGLEPGEQIVINGLQRVRPGMKVIPTTAPMSVDSTVDTAAR
jgi:multidrug efflux system membrane fusion protein